MDNTALMEFRQAAVIASGGSSTFVIKDAILRELGKLSRPARLLDYGSGQGELLRLIDSLYPDTDLSGSDFMERPADFPARINWLRADLNDGLQSEQTFDVIICSEVIEHLENPRAVFRNLFDLLRPGGTLILTMPNQESIRSFVALLGGGHFAAFRGSSYPAHITALLHIDLERMCAETGFAVPAFSYTESGGLPKKPAVTWQKISFGKLRGRRYSDNLVMVTQKPKV